MLFIAYADGGLSSEIRAGENRGVRLAHEHMVRDFRRAGPPDAQGRVSAHESFARPREPGVAPAVVALVQRSSNGDVLQTATLPLDGCGSN